MGVTPLQTPHAPPCYTVPRMARDDFNFSHTLRVRWAECDVQGVVYSAAYANFVEIGQAEYFRNLGIAIYDPAMRRHLDFATVKMSLDFFAAAHLDDVLSVCWKIDRLGNSSLTALCEIYRGCDEEPLTRAVVIYVNHDEVTRNSRPVPDDVRRLIDTFESTGRVIPLADLPGLAAIGSGRA